MKYLLVAAMLALGVACETGQPSDKTSAPPTLAYPADTQHLKPGQTCPKSGQYRNSSTDKQATCVKGETMPPGPAGSTWSLTDATRHAE